MAANAVALRKRAQIAKANRTMFLWIAASSIVIGAAVVVAVFLVQQLVYNEDVLAEKNKTVGILEDNNAAVETLQQEIRALDANAALASAKANEGDQTLQVILDALPADANSLALGASFQQKLLSGIGGLSLESLSVTEVDTTAESDTASTESDTTTASDSSVPTDETTTTDTETASVSAPSIAFSFTVTGNQDVLKQVLNNLQRSIRLMDIRSFTVDAASEDTGEQTMTVNGQAYYVPAKTIELKDKVVPRR